MDEAILLKDFWKLKGQDRLKDDVKLLIERKVLKTVMVKSYE